MNTVLDMFKLELSKKTVNSQNSWKQGSYICTHVHRNIIHNNSKVKETQTYVYRQSDEQ